MVEQENAEGTKEETKKSLGVKLRHAQFSYRKIGFLLVAVALVVGGVVFYQALGAPSQNGFFDEQLKGPIIFEKRIQATLATSPKDDSPLPNYEPTAFELRDDGVLTCAVNTQNNESKDELKPYFGIKSGTLTAKEKSDFIQSVKASKLEALPLVTGSNNLVKDQRAKHRTSYTYLNNGDITMAVLIEAEGVAKPAQMQKVDGLIDSLCQQKAKNDYVPNKARITIKTISLKRDKDVTRLSPDEVQQISQNPKLLQAINASKKDPQLIEEQDDQLRQLLSTIFGKSTVVGFEKEGKLVTLTYEPFIKDDQKSQHENLGLSLSTAVRNYYDKLQEQGGLLGSLQSRLFSKAEAEISGKDYQVIFVPYEGAPSYDENMVRNKLSSAIGATQNWYLHELDQQRSMVTGFTVHLSSPMKRSQYRDGTEFCPENDNDCWRRDYQITAGNNNDNVLLGIEYPGKDISKDKIYVLDYRYLPSEDACGWAQMPAHHAIVFLDFGTLDPAKPGNDVSGCPEFRLANNKQSYRFGRTMAHELGHTYGMDHTANSTSANEAGIDIMDPNIQLVRAFPANIAGSPDEYEIHFSTTQKNYLKNSSSGCQTMAKCKLVGKDAPSIPPSTPQPAPAPRCNNNALKDPQNYDGGYPRHCDDGNWRPFIDMWIPWPTTANQLHFVYYQNVNTPAICGTKSGAPVGSLPDAGPDYMYEQSCSDLNVLKQWVANYYINQIGPKINAIQDVKHNGGGVRPPRNTGIKYANFGMRGMTTWPSYQKRDQEPRPLSYFPFYLPMPNFIADPHGYLSINSQNNFWGNVWGTMDGRYVAASNMKPGSPFIFGPFENPGGAPVAQATRQGRKAMKVCWTIKDITAAETGNLQHSLVRLEVTSNGGGFNFTPGQYSVYQLKGGGWGEYCQDNIRISDSRVQNLEYPVTLVSGQVAVSNISRTIYWPDQGYSIHFPSTTKYDTNDPVVKQANTSAANNQCDYQEGAFASSGCQINVTTSIGVTSDVFSAPKNSGSKEICTVVSKKLDADQALWLYIYSEKQSTPAKVLTLKDVNRADFFNRPMYCANFQAANKSIFKSATISTNTSKERPIIVNSLTVR